MLVSLSLQKVVNFAARVIYCKRKSEHVTPLLKNLNWLTVENKLCFDTLVLMYRVAHCAAPGGVTALFRYVHDTSMRTTRQSRDCYEPMGRTEAGRRTVACRGSRLWNNLPQSLRDVPSLSSFKRQLRRRLLNQQWSWEIVIVIDSSHYGVIDSSHYGVIDSSHHGVIDASHYGVIDSSHHGVIDSSHYGVIDSSHHGVIDSSHYGVIDSSHHGVIDSSHYGVIDASHYGVIDSSHYGVIPPLLLVHYDAVPLR